MAKKLSAAMAKRLKSMCVNVKTEEDARKKLLAVLEKEGIEGMDDEDLDTLIDMAGSFLEGSDAEEEEVDEEETNDSEEEEDDDEKDANDLADEVEEEEAEEEPEDSDEDEETDEEDSEEEDEETEEAEEAEEEKKPAKKSAKKEAKKPAAKKKEEKKPAAKKPTKRGVKLDPKNNEEDQDAFKPLRKLFAEKEYVFTWLSNNGVTIKYIGKNGKRGICTIENCTKKTDGTIICNLYLLTMTKETDKLDDMGIAYDLCWTKAPFMKGITLEEAIEILEKVFDIVTSFVTTVDKRLGANRKKMEENLEKGSKKTSAKKKVEKPAPEPEEEDEEEDDEEEEVKEEKKPAKKAVAKKPAKKSKK